MGPGTQLSFCLPCESDEGICPMALVLHLRDEHNNLVFAVDERMLTGRRTSQQHGDRRGAAAPPGGGPGGAAGSASASPSSRVASSAFMTSAHAVAYDLAA